MENDQSAKYSLSNNGTTDIAAYLDQPSIRELLGVDSTIGPFISCSRPVGEAFFAHLDRYQPTTYYVAELLERGVKVLIYAGTHDFQWYVARFYYYSLSQEKVQKYMTRFAIDSNYLGNYRWTAAMEWTGHDAFHAEKLREWMVNEKVAGMTRSAKGLTFATVYEAGHMVTINFYLVCGEYQL